MPTMLPVFVLAWFCGSKEGGSVGANPMRSVPPLRGVPSAALTNWDGADAPAVPVDGAPPVAAPVVEPTARVGVGAGAEPPHAATSDVSATLAPVPATRRNRRRRPIRITGGVAPSR